MRTTVFFPAMHLVRRNGNSMENMITRALHLRLCLRFASLILILVEPVVLGGCRGSKLALAEENLSFQGFPQL